MDPDENLRQQKWLRARRGSLDGEARKAANARLRDLRQAMQDWLRAGGFLPAAWRTKR